LALFAPTPTLQALSAPALTPILRQRRPACLPDDEVRGGRQRTGQQQRGGGPAPAGARWGAGPARTRAPARLPDDDVHGGRQRVGQQQRGVQRERGLQRRDRALQLARAQRLKVLERVELGVDLARAGRALSVTP